MARAQRLLQCMSVPEQKRDLLTNVRTPSEVVLFVSMLAGDKLSLLFDQMGPRGHAVTVGAARLGPRCVDYAVCLRVTGCPS